MNILANVGNTPLIKLGSFNDKNIFGKWEAKNPMGSIKDRAALNMIDTAIKEGKITSETIVVEATSGNTGIGLAFVCAVKGIKLRIYLPEHMSEERKKILKAFGTQLILTPKNKGISGSVIAAKEFAKSSNAFYVDQFNNPSNAMAHYISTAPEIYRDMKGEIGAIVCPIGSAGTITGIGKFMKSINKEIKIIGVEPELSPTIKKGISAPHKIQGIAPGFVPGIYNPNVVDDIICVSDDEAYEMTRYLARKEGLFVGISSGASLAASLKLNVEKPIVAILPDTGERYLSVENLFNA
ncbi:MAG: cysteine synthase A [Thermodesulfobium narugense]|nr:MAG: cysteine synthase A [Thermodesulfobium narugense]